MKPKMDRHKEILKVVSDRSVGTQAELRRVLSGRGHKVDQATLSRDIHELGLVKVTDGNGSYRYAPVERISPPVRANSESVVGGTVLSVAASRNLVVIKTDPGNASPLGLAFDRLAWPEVIGTVAGDDTVLLVLKETASAKKMAHRIEGLRK